VQDFRKLTVWQAARRLARRTYESTMNLPEAERYGLSAQMRRAAVSVCANVAEGCGRGSAPDFRRFLLVAMGSACELECETILACDLGLLTNVVRGELLAELEDVKRMLTGLIKRVEATALTTEN
jgi:four helix bundle protein